MIYHDSSMHQVGSTLLPVFWPRELSLSAARPHSREEERVGRCCAEEAPRMQRKPSVIRHCNLEKDLYSRLPMEVAMNINSIKNSGFSSHLKFGIVKQYQKNIKTNSTQRFPIPQALKYGSGNRP